MVIRMVIHVGVTSVSVPVSLLQLPLPEQVATDQGAHHSIRISLCACTDARPLFLRGNVLAVQTLPTSVTATRTTRQPSRYIRCLIRSRFKTGCSPFRW